jgi:hypothetical protein
VDAVIVASLRQLDVKLAQQRPLAMPDSEFMGLELLYVGHWSYRNRLKGFRLKAEGRAINQFRMVHGSTVQQLRGRLKVDRLKAEGKSIKQLNSFFFTFSLNTFSLQPASLTASSGLLRTKTISSGVTHSFFGSCFSICSPFDYDK